MQVRKSTDSLQCEVLFPRVKCSYATYYGSSLDLGWNCICNALILLQAEFCGQQVPAAFLKIIVPPT